MLHPVRCEQHGHTLTWVENQPPDAVIYPQTSDEVVEIVKLCAAHKVPVIPFGTGSSLEGHVNAPQGGVSVDTSMMNHTIKDATVKRYHYDSYDQLRRHLNDFINAHDFGHRLKTFMSLTPYEFICKQWALEPERFRLRLIHQMPVLNT